MESRGPLTSIKFDGVTLWLPVDAASESRVLATLLESDDNSEVDLSAAGVRVTQETLNQVQQLLQGRTMDTITEDQWLAIAHFANWLDMDRLHRPVIDHYRSWLSKGPQWIRGWHLGCEDLDKRVDIPLARRILGKNVHDVGDIHATAVPESVWATTIVGGHCSEISSFAVLHDGRLASTDGCGDVLLHDIATNSCEYLPFGSSSHQSMTVLPDGRLAVSYSSELGIESRIVLWDTATNACTAILVGHHGCITCMAVLHDGRLASGCSDQLVILWDTTTNRCTAKLDGHRGGMFALAVLPDTRLAAAHDSIINLWDVNTNELTATLEANAYPVSRLAVLPDGRLAAGAWDAVIYLWNTTTLSYSAMPTGHLSTIEALAVLPDGRLAALVTRSGSGHIWIWNTDTQECVEKICSCCFVGGAVAVLPDGRLVAQSKDNSIQLIDTTSHVCTILSQGHPSSVSSLDVLSDGRIAVSYLYDTNSIMIWDPNTSMCETTLVGHTRDVNVLAVLTDGRLASGSDDCLVFLWDVASKTYTVLAGHSNSVHALSEVPKSSILASGSLDKTIRLWDTVSGSCLRTLNCSCGIVEIVVMPEGDFMAARAGFGCAESVEVWRVHTHERIPECTKFVRNILNLPTPRTSDTILTWIERLEPMEEKHERCDLMFSTYLPDGRAVEVTSDRALLVEGKPILFVHRAEELTVTGNGDLVVSSNGMLVLRDVSLRANAFLALTAAGVPSVYILQVLSNSHK